MNTGVAELTEDGECPSIARLLMSAEWTQLAAPIRVVHASRPITLSGRATVVRGRSWFARLMGSLSGLPPEQHNGSVRILLEQIRGGRQERWTRFFGDAPAMRSSLRRAGDSLDETVGITRLRFRLSLEGGSIRWSAVAGRTLGIPWPRSWLAGIDACESHRGNHYYFNVRAAVPIFGLIVHYVGEVAVVNP
jgi:hypothetical protein